MGGGWVSALALHMQYLHLLCAHFVVQKKHRNVHNHFRNIDPLQSFLLVEKFVASVLTIKTGWKKKAHRRLCKLISEFWSVPSKWQKLRRHYSPVKVY